MLFSTVCQLNCGSIFGGLGGLSVAYSFSSDIVDMLSLAKLPIAYHVCKSRTPPKVLLNQPCPQVDA